MTPHLNGWLSTIGWTLLHFVWQGGVVALAMAAVLAACRRRSADVRYGAACLGLAVLVAAPVATAVVLRFPETVPVVSRVPADPAPAAGSSIAAAPGGATARLGATAARTSAAVEPWLPVVVWTWLGGVVLLLARLGRASWRVRRLRLAANLAPPSRWQAAGDRIAARLGIGLAFRIVDSTLVDVPSVIGLLKPVVLLPVAALTNLTPGQIEALVAHELAHIRRRDYAVNILQTAAEALLFFHPAVWWMSARIRQEREHCCDDIAVAVCREPVVYASALAELAALTPGRGRERALAIGAADGALLTRVRRILEPPEPHVPRAAGGSIALLIGVLLTVGLAAQSALQKPSAAAPAGERIVTVKTNRLVEEFGLRTTDHFLLFYQRDLDLHAERVAREAEAAYTRVSGDLRHNLARSIPLFVLRSAAEIERVGPTADISAAGVANTPDDDRIMLAVDVPADQWLGIITHEVAHVFGFDILPSKSIAPWIREGLAEYERGTWDPSDLALLRDAVRANSVPAISRLQGDDRRSPRFVPALGHAAFDFVESRSGKAGVRQFLFALRKTADTGADPFEAGLQMNRDAFDRAFEAYLRGRFAAAGAGPAVREAPAADTRVRVEGDVTSVRWPVAAGLACVELWVPIDDGMRQQRWALECGAGGDEVTGALKPGDRVVATGPIARGVTGQRLTLESLTRPSDGFAWRSASR